MNPVCSYHDFLEFMQYSSDGQDKLIPILLIKPSSILYLNRKRFLGNVFSYFDKRSGQHIQFFLPGYAHYPDIAFAEIFPMMQPYKCDAVAFSIERLGRIYYSERAFVDFIEKLEEHAPHFIYRGDTELLFIKYLANPQCDIGQFDFSEIHRYNISRLFCSQHIRSIKDFDRLNHVAHFLEDVIFEIRTHGNNDDELIRAIHSRYNMYL